MDALDGVEEVWENQRAALFGKGWGANRLPTDRPLWSDKKGHTTLQRESFLLPAGWVWCGPWTIEERGDEGWYYAPDFTVPTRFCTWKPNPTSLVRRRKWVRRRVPLLPTAGPQMLMRNMSADHGLDALGLSAAAASAGTGSAPAASLLASAGGSSGSDVSGGLVPLSPPMGGVFAAVGARSGVSHNNAGQGNGSSVAGRVEDWSTVVFYGFLVAPSGPNGSRSSSSEVGASDGGVTEAMSATETAKERTRNHKGYAALVALCSAAALCSPGADGTTAGATESTTLGASTANAGGGSEGTLASAVEQQHQQQLSSSHRNASSPTTTPLMSEGSPSASPFSPAYALTPDSRAAFGAASPPASVQTRAGWGGATTGSEGPLKTAHFGGNLRSSQLSAVYQFGVPYVLRRPLWVKWARVEAMRAANPEYYASLSAAAALITSGETFIEIQQDVVRTAPKHPFFEGRGSTGSLRLTNTLLALTLHRDGAMPYHQAFSYVVAALLLNLSAEEAFWTMIAIVEGMLPSGYHNAYVLQDDLRIAAELLQSECPKLDAFFALKQIDMSVFASGWLQGLFCAHLPLPTACRIIDVLLAEGGSTMLVRLLLAFLTVHSSEIIAMCDGSGSLGQMANAWARNAYDIDRELTVAGCVEGGVGGSAALQRMNAKILQRRHDLSRSRAAAAAEEGS